MLNNVLAPLTFADVALPHYLPFTSTAEPIGKQKLQRLLQKVQQKLQGSEDNSLPEEYPSLNQPLDIDTYQPEDSGYHSNQEMVGYQKEGGSEEGDTLSEEKENQVEEEEKHAVLHQQLPVAQHMKASKNNDLHPGEKVTSMADVYFLGKV